MGNNRGIAFIESVVAILLLAIVVSGNMFVMSAAKMYASSGRYHYQAVSLAREELERIVAGEAPTTGAVTIDSATGLTGTLSVTNPTTDTIEVTVTWADGQEGIVLYIP